MKILVLNQHFYPEVASSGQILTELCEDMVKRGHGVTVITGLPSYRRSDELSSAKDKHSLDKTETSSGSKSISWLLKLLPDGIMERGSAFGVEIIRVYNYSPELRTGRWRLVQRAIQYISFFVSSALVAFLLPRHDMVLYLSTPPLLNGVTANMLKIFKGTPNVYNIQDLYPDVAIRLNVLKSRFIIFLCRFLENFLYSGADLIVPVGSSMAYLLEKKGVPRNKIIVIPNWMDTEKIKPLGKINPFVERNGLRDKFVVMYSGNIGLSQGLENVIEAADLTRDLPELVYVLIGGGANLKYVKDMAEKLSLHNVVFLPYQPKERLSESLSSADVHLLTLKAGLSTFSVPSKLFGIMASGRPLVASVDSESEISWMVREANCGVSIEPEDPAALAKAIRTLYYDRSKLDVMGGNGRRYLESKITRSICVNRYISIFERVGLTNN